MKISRALALAAALLPATSSSPPTSSGTGAHQHRRALSVPSIPSADRQELNRKVWDDFRRHTFTYKATCEEECIGQYKAGLIWQIKGCVPACRNRRAGALGWLQRTTPR